MTFCLFLLVLLFKPYTLKADAFPHSSKSLGGLIFSLELIGSYEMVFSENNSLLLWGGYATVFSPFGLEVYGGPEAAVEWRHYFRSKKDKLWSFGLYAGGAYNIIGEPYSALTPGMKLTKIRKINKSLQMEPYMSISYPYYMEEGSFPYIPFLTLGCRFVFGWNK